MNSKRRIPFWAVISVLGLLIPLGAAAQGSGIHIHETPNPQQVTTASGAVGLSLQPSFSLLDSENQVMMAFEVESATIELEGNSFPALVQELETPWTIVVLVDASRTMGGFAAAATFKTVRSAMSSAIGGVPENTNIALLTFDDGVQTRLEFTQETDKVNAALRGVIAKSFGNSCLNNGLSEAVNKLSGAPGRRAVILFTASADDCATRTTQEVVDLALRNGVQIYPVGLLGYAITQEALSALADPTGGLSELKDESTLGFGFSNIMAVLNNQWTARATIYPSAGEQQAILTINLKDETVLTSPPITFVSAQDYVPPAEIYLKGNVQSTGEGILFNLDIVQAAVIRQLNVSIISVETGQSVLAQAMISFSDVNTLPAVGLIPGAEYTLIVNAVDAQGQLLSEATAEFKYEPPPAQLSITQVQEPTAEREAFLVIVSSQNVGPAVKHKAWLMEEENQLRLEATEVTIPLGEPILIPAEGVKAGTYLVVVQALDSADTVLAESPPARAVVTRRGFIESLSSTVSGSPLAIVGLTLFCLLSLGGIVAIVWFVLPKRRVHAGTVELVMPQKELRQAPGARRPISPSALEREESTPPSAQKPVPQPPRKPASQAASKPGAQPPRKPASSPAPKPAPQAAPKPAPEASPKPAPEPSPKPAPQTPQQPAAPSESLAGPSASIRMVEPAVDFTAQMTQSVFTIGRKASVSAKLPLDSASGVSGEHLTIRFINGQYFAQDDNSTYGTEIDCKEIDKGRPYPLRDGAIITLGPKVKIEFRVGG